MRPDTGPGRNGHSTAILSRILIAVSLVSIFGCGGGQKPLIKLEAAPVAPATPSDQKQDIAKLPPPELNSVQEAVRRVFKDSALIDTSRPTSFIAGDFNGDLSQDIAVVVKPAPEKLAEMNEEFPNWILRDPLGSTESRSPRLRVGAGDVLLAVIHGYGSNGWRDSQATQTYLLRNAVGSGLQTRSVKEFASEGGKRKLPRLRGDVLSEALQGRPGFLYYAGATYAWYDPKTFTGERDPRRGHGSQGMTK